MSLKPPRLAAKAQNVLAEAKHIVLGNIPKTSTPWDVLKALRQVELQNLKSVRIHYKAYRPTGKAVLTMNAAEHTREAVQRLANISLGPRTVSVTPTLDEQYHSRRLRGQKGKFDAMMRGAITGDGPSAGGFHSRTTVTLTGLHHATEPESIVPLLKGYVLEGDTSRAILKCVRSFEDKKKHGIRTNYSRFILLFKTSAEAERFVRTYDQLDYEGWKLSAEIIY